MTDLHARYSKLLALAQDQDGTPEGETAARMAAAMLERFPELMVPEAKPVQLVIATRHSYDAHLLTRIAAFMGIEAYRIGRKRPGGKGVRWREGLQVEGPAGVLELINTFYQAHRARMDVLIKWTALGYAVGAFPVDQADRANDGPGLTPEQLEAAQAGLAAGERNRDTIPEARRLAPRALEG